MTLGTATVGLVKRMVLAVQDFTLLLVGSFRRTLTPPRYIVDTLLQMDVIGVGSLPIVVLTGFFTGGVLALQTYRTLSTFGEVSIMGQVVALSVVRELGPVLTALMVAGRISSGIASEIGSMLVSEQIDAMRAFGTDPIRKLVLPRLIATLSTLPVLTILSDFCGILGGFFISYYTVRLTSEAILDFGLSDVDDAGRRPRPAETLRLCLGHRPGGLLLRLEHKRGHGGRRPVHHAGHGSSLCVDSGARLLYHQVPDRHPLFLRAILF